MKTKYPHSYVASIERIGPGTATLTAPPRPALTGGPPPEFQGDARVWSPEHLLAAALGLCLFTTFEAFAARDNLEVLGYRDVVTALLDRTSSGLAFTSFTICVELTVAPTDIERARAILERAKQFCIVSKALHVPVAIEPHIWSQDQREHASCAS
jgi:organic hydroperoxide reductase OsmC/OhrA